MANLQPRDKLLTVATQLFCRDGIHATGIETILQASGVARMTLYNRFGSKEGLVQAVLEREGETWRRWFFSAVEAAGEGPRQRLAAVFPVLRSWFERDDYYGCAFINAVAEHSKGDEHIRSITLAHKSKVIAYLTGLAEGAGCRDPDGLAHQLGILMDGAIVAALVTGDPVVGDHASRMADLAVAASLME